MYVCSMCSFKLHSKLWIFANLQPHSTKLISAGPIPSDDFHCLQTSICRHLVFALRFVPNVYPPQNNCLTVYVILRKLIRIGCRLWNQQVGEQSKGHSSLGESSYCRLWSTLPLNSASSSHRKEKSYPLARWILFSWHVFHRILSCVASVSDLWNAAHCYFRTICEKTQCIILECLHGDDDPYPLCGKASLAGRRVIYIAACCHPEHQSTGSNMNILFSKETYLIIPIGIAC